MGKCLINHAAALAPGHAFLAIRELRVAVVATVTRLNAVGPQVATPQALRHAAQHRHTRRAATLHLLNYAILAFTAVIWACQCRGHHQPQYQHQYWHNSCCRWSLLHLFCVSKLALVMVCFSFELFSSACYFLLWW